MSIKKSFNIYFTLVKNGIFYLKKNKYIYTSGALIVSDHSADFRHNAFCRLTDRVQPYSIIYYRYELYTIY